MISRSIVALAAALALLAGPLAAHEKHRNEAAEQHQRQPQPAGGRDQSAIQQASATQHDRMGEMMGETGADRARITIFERLLDWIGRLHPTIVHFPIAFFPAALFTAIAGRRRPGFGAPVRFLVVAGGVTAPIAAMLGWLDAIGAESSLLLTVHRWLGTAIGLGGLGLAVWVWRRPDQDRSGGMIVALGVLTAALVVQGWYGGALVHGIEHLNW